MALDWFRYRDPLQVLLIEEGKTCKGCKFEKTERLFGERTCTCTKRRKHGKRCKVYQDQERER